MNWQARALSGALIGCFAVCSCRAHDECRTGDTGCDLALTAQFLLRYRISRFLYVPSQTTNYASAFSIDRYSGRLTLLQSIGSFPGAPNGSCVDEVGRYYYVPEQTASGPVWPFAVDTYTGRLTAESQFGTSFGGNPQACVALGGQVFVVTAAAGANTHFFTARSYGGAATSGATSGSRINADPTGGYLIVSDSSTNNFYVMRRNSNGTLSALGGVAIGGNAGSPAFTSANRFYLATGAGNISGYDFSNGVATLISGSTISTGTAPTNAAVDPSGRFLYVTNNGSANISAYILSGSGIPTAVSGSPFATAANPNQIAIDATGQWAYVSHASGTVAVLAINPSTGALTQLQSIGAGTIPTDLRIVSQNISPLLGLPN